MTLIRLLFSLVTFAQSNYFIITPANVVPDLNNIVRVEVDSKIKSSDYAKYSYYVRSDKNQINSDKSDLKTDLEIHVPNVKNNDYLYLQIESKQTKEKYYTNKIQVYSRSVYKKYLDKLTVTPLPTLPEISISNLSSKQSSEIIESTLPISLDRFTYLDSNVLYVGLALTLFSGVVAWVFWYFFRDGG